MIQALRHVRDFLDDDQMQQLLPGLQARTCLLLKKTYWDGEKGSPDRTLRTRYLIFDEGGTFIGPVQAEWWPGRD